MSTTLPTSIFVSDKFGYRVSANFLSYDGTPVIDVNTDRAIEESYFLTNSPNEKASKNSQSYLIVPADFSVSRAISTANQVKNILSSYRGYAGALLYFAQNMGGAESQDLQTHYNGIVGHVVYDFTDAASWYYGFVVGYSGLSLSNFELFAGNAARFKNDYTRPVLNTIIPLFDKAYDLTAPFDVSGNYGNSQINAASMQAGYDYAENLLGSGNETENSPIFHPDITVLPGNKTELQGDQYITGYNEGSFGSEIIDFSATDDNIGTAAPASCCSPTAAWSASATWTIPPNTPWPDKTPSPSMAGTENTWHSCG
jgi:hypothetical protein